MKTIPLSEAKATLSEVVDDVARTRERVTITRNGRPVPVLIAPEDLEGMAATIELLTPAGPRHVCGLKGVDAVEAVRDDGENNSRCF